MRKGIILAAFVLITAAFTGCAIQVAFPGFLLPAFGDVASASPSASPLPSPAETAAPSETAGPTATPQPEASPAPSEDPEPYEVLARYESAMPEGLPVHKEYSRYSTPMNYFVALKSGAVYAEPDTGSKKLASFGLGARYELDKLVQGRDGESKWYHVLWSDKQGSHEGYAISSVGAARSFRVDMMLERLNALQKSADEPGSVYIVNYKNRHGKPPALPGGKTVDEYGNRRDQSAPAHTAPDAKSPFRYAPDGLLGTRQDKANGMTKVYFPSFGAAYWVPDKYLSTQPDCIAQLTQAVVVDRANQNSGTFELQNGRWTLIALTYVSTGKQGGYSLKTPLGSFMAQSRSSKFYYYYDGTQTIEGYAPWAIRFSGGGYLHGVPRAFRYDEYGNRVDPGLAESLRSLGTTPQSHMCVRNYTSYAKFIYDWYKQGQCAVIVFE
jgi:hypothetical protein